MAARARIALAFLAAALWPVWTLAQTPRVVEVRPAKAGEWLVVDVRGADLLDERTRSTIESGLPGSCWLQLRLLRSGRGVDAKREVQRSLELDLWDGRVWLREGSEERAFSGLAAADSAFSRFDAIRLFPLDRLLSSARYAIEARLVVTPLAPEDRERVSRWVSRSESESGGELSFNVGGLLRHFVGGGEEDSEEEAARVVTPPFTRAELEENP